MNDKVLVIFRVAVLVMFSPGPDMVIVTRNTLPGGRPGGLRISHGVLAGNLALIIDFS